MAARGSSLLTDADADAEDADDEDADDEDAAAADAVSRRRDLPGLITGEDATDDKADDELGRAVAALSEDEDVSLLLFLLLLLLLLANRPATSGEDTAEEEEAASLFLAEECAPPFPPPRDMTGPVPCMLLAAEAPRDIVPPKAARLPPLEGLGGAEEEGGCSGPSSRCCRVCEEEWVGRVRVCEEDVAVTTALQLAEDVAVECAQLSISSSFTRISFSPSS
jgi:hypothetical protein